MEEKMKKSGTERMQVEEASDHNDPYFRLKLENEISSSQKMDDLELSEIIDVQTIKPLMRDFYKLTHIPIGLNDLKGNVLVGVGWQDVCTKFHRVHPETSKYCIESDVKLSSGVTPGEFKMYKCKNNMWDIVTPIMVGEHHVGYVFSGQFFFEEEPLDYELFRAQAKKYGFNEEEYIAALEKVPRLSRETVNTGMGFFMAFANMLSQQGYNNIKLVKSLAERDALVDELRESRKDLDRAQEVGNIGSWRLDVHKNEFICSDENHRIFGIPKDTPLTYEAFLSTVHPDDREYVDKEWKAGLKGEPYDIEHRIVVDGKIKWVREKAYIEFDKDGAIVNGFGITQDITERKQAEHQLSNELARATGLYELYTRSPILSDHELYDFALNQAVKITDSIIGFFHLVSEDEKEIILTTWNQEALRSCTAGNEGHYPIEKAGNWVDCVRLKRPVVYNDFPSSPNQKGLPAGHTTVKRFMSVPVTENGKVRIIFGVGNKVDEYDDRDVMQLQLVANELHKIMKLRRVENEVRESEAFLRDIMENVSDAIFVKDREARMILANPAYYKLMGKSHEEFFNESITDFHPPEIAKKLAEDDKRVMETGKGTTSEERIFTSHGWRILQTVKAPYYDGQGNIRGLIGVAQDITDRRQTEEALKKVHESLEEKVKERTSELEEAYKALMESERSLAEAQRMAHLGNWDWNLLTDELYWSDETCRIFGISSKEFGSTYNSFYSYVHPDDQENVDNAVKEALNGKPHNIDYRIISADGEDRVVHSHGEVIFNERNIPVRMIGTVQDITERKKAEEKIRNLANIVESSDDAIITESLDYIITSWNKGAEQVYGYSAEEILGKPIYILAPPHLEGETRELVERVKQGKRIQQYETLRLRKDGRIINVSITLSPVFDIYGKLTAVSLIYRDITKRKKAEEALEKIQETHIKEIHHRIKNNLQIISSLLSLEADKFSDERMLESFRESQNRVFSMALIHEELYKGKELDTLDFASYLQKLTADLFGSYNLSDNICLKLDLEQIHLDMDIAIPLGIIVNELVSNSLKHAFPAGRAGEICINLCRTPFMGKNDFRYVLTVADNGKGIPEEIDFTNTDSLGFQLVNLLVEQMEGRIELKRDHGTKFIIWFNNIETSANNVY